MRWLKLLLLGATVALVSSADDRIANAAASDILHMAGHAPTKRLQISQPSAIEQRYDGLTENELAAFGWEMRDRSDAGYDLVRR